MRTSEQSPSSQFKASHKTAELVVASQTKEAREVRHLDVTSSHVPHPDEPVNLEQVREAIGERLHRLLGTVARWHATIEPTCRQIQVLANGEFISEVSQGLMERLHMEESATARKAIVELAEEFSRWAHDCPDRDTYGIEVASQDQVFIRCPDLKPILGPLIE
ncbi:hypothetical protein HYS30_02405 [Candidatus Peregrinibacteria bacterium]|nr:hypothetical protein [Candidatus Peregrinibacteria bacterium]